VKNAIRTLLKTFNYPNVFMTTTPKPYPCHPLPITGGLRGLASDLISTVSSTALRNESFFVNDIPDDLDIDTDPQLVASVLGGMISTLAHHAKNSCIRLSAKIYHDVILVHVKDYNSSHNYDIYNGVQGLMPMAEKIGGFVGVSSHRHSVTTVAFSFPNLPAAA
jgi:hypothetical protein